MEEKKESLLKGIRKELNVNTKTLDAFIDASSTSTKYYLEDSFETNKMFKYLLFLKLKGVNINKFFSDYIKYNNIKPPKE